MSIRILFSAALFASVSAAAFAQQGATTAKPAVNLPPNVQVESKPGAALTQQGTANLKVPSPAIVGEKSSTGGNAIVGEDTLKQAASGLAGKSPGNDNTGGKLTAGVIAPIDVVGKSGANDNTGGKGPPNDNGGKLINTPAFSTTGIAGKVENENGKGGGKLVTAPAAAGLVGKHSGNDNTGGGKGPPNDNGGKLINTPALSTAGIAGKVENENGKGGGKLVGQVDLGTSATVQNATGNVQTNTGAMDRNAQPGSAAGASSLPRGATPGGRPPN